MLEVEKHEIASLIECLKKPEMSSHHLTVITQHFGLNLPELPPWTLKAFQPSDLSFSMPRPLVAF